MHELWRHAQSLPQYKDKTTLLVVPELGRDGDMLGNGFANHRSGDESCRRVWLVALGAGVPKGAGTERPIKTTDVAPTVARILGVQDAGVRRPAARRAGGLTSLPMMRFDARLTGEAATLAQGARADARAAAGDRSRVDPVELQKWTTLFAPERRYQRALLEHLSGLPAPERERLFAAIARVEADAGCDRIATAIPAGFQDEAQALLRKRRLLSRWRREVDAVLPTDRAGARRPALSRRTRRAG